MSDDNFKIDTDVELGIAYASYKNKIYKLAITKPELYYNIREEAVKELKGTACKTLYNVIYYFLKNGTFNGVKNGPDMTQRAKNGGITEDLRPQLPSADINKIALGASETLNKIIDDCIKLALPPDYKSIAEAKLSQAAEAKL